MATSSGRSERNREHEQVLKPEIAYEVTSCLTDALTEGTGRLAYEKYGLKKFPAAGKTGTAYDFTDALFAGYDSTITCAVWAGFDKPAKNLSRRLRQRARAARLGGRDERLPRQICGRGRSPSRPVCTRSRSVQSPACSRPTSATKMCAVRAGDVVKRRTSYVELATDEQMPADRCDVHGDSVRTQLVKKFESSQWPRAALAVDTNASRAGRDARADPARDG